MTELSGAGTAGPERLAGLVLDVVKKIEVHVLSDATWFARPLLG